MNKRVSDVPVFRTVADLRAQVRAWRRAGETVALVPTMGALHRGHAALVAEARRRATRTLASIFVNPTQFAPTEDLSAYPRTLEADLATLREAQADGCFAPGADAMYPAGFATTVTVDGPAKADLEDRFRPTHFAGVATVVAKLLSQAQCDVAVFGEKDFQQLRVVQRMARDLDLPCEIVGLPTVREDDGLALSSRNIYLSAQEREIAPTLQRALRTCADRIDAGQPIDEAVQNAVATVTAVGFVVDYIEARDADTLARLSTRARPMRLLAAAKLGRTRLIDNIEA